MPDYRTHASTDDLDRSPYRRNEGAPLQLTGHTNDSDVMYLEDNRSVSGAEDDDGRRCKCSVGAAEEVKQRAAKHHQACHADDPTQKRHAKSETTLLPKSGELPCTDRE